MSSELMMADEVAERLRVPRSWVYLAARNGDLPSVRCGRYRRFDARDIDDWIAEQKERWGGPRSMPRRDEPPARGSARTP